MHAPDAAACMKSYPQSRSFAGLLIDDDEDRVVRTVLVGMLREMERK